MKTLLIPVDFTPASENAIKFACEWSRKYNYKRIILLRTFYTSMYENLIMSAEYANVNEDYINRNREQQKQQLHDLCKMLDEQTGEDIKVQTATSELPLLRSIMEVMNSEQPDMILLGTDNINNSNEAFISGNIIGITKMSPVRVMIVPSDYTYQAVESALVPCDFNSIDILGKVDTLRSVPQWRDVHLCVLNVDARQQHLNPDEKFRQAESMLHDYLKNFHHEIVYAADKKVINGIIGCNKINEMQLLIALPGRYSFLRSLTHRSISEALYRNSHLPVLILK